MKLSREQRKAFFDGHFPKLAGDGICPVQAGHIFRLSSRVRVEVARVRRPQKGGWSLEYVVYDQRPDQDRYLRPVASPIPVDEKGRPLPMTADEEHGYTTSPKSRLAESAPVVPTAYQNVLVVEAKERFASHRRKVDADKEAEKDLRAVQAEIRELVKRAVKMGIPPSTVIAPIAREIKAQHRDLQDAA